MDFSEFQEKYTPILKQYAVPLLLGLFGFGFLLYGLIASVSHKNQQQDILVDGVNSTSSPLRQGSEGQAGRKQITIDIEGAVIKPGVYKLEKDARIQDALIASGGMSDEADRGKIAKGLNLASKVVDGGKIYIPFVGETSAPAGGSSLTQGSNGASAVMGESTSGLININSASATELDALPGVGPATSQKIINSRPYEKIEDLVSKKAVGQSVFTKIKEKISVY